jgi:GNAT superfamily N-acetyltransferase
MYVEEKLLKRLFRAASLDNDDLNILKDIAKRVIRLNYTPFLGANAVHDFIESGQADKEIDDGIHNCTLLTGNGVTIGFAITKESLLHLIMIDTGFQRSGYGSKLLRYVENELFMRYDCIYLNSFKANIIANRFYIKNGWRLVQNDEEREADDMMIKFEKRRSSTAESLQLPVYVASDFVANIEKIHTTRLGIERIRKNLGLDIDDPIAWCKLKIKKAEEIVRKGKNWYVYVDNIVITINGYSYTIITAHRR